MNIFKNRNFSILLSSRFIANVGSSLYAVAAMWLVYQLGGSTFYSGLAMFLTSIPAVLQVFLGPLIDQLNPKKLLVYPQFILALLLLVIPVAEYFHVLNVAVVLVVMPLISILNQFIYPTQLSILPKILDGKDLSKGNSLFTVAYQGTNALFTGVAGIIVVILSTTAIFLINSVAFLFTAFILMALNLDYKAAIEEENPNIKNTVRSYLESFKEGMKIVASPILLSMLIGVIFVNMAGIGLNVVLPAYSEAMFGPQLYGFLLAGAGLGIVIGAALVSIVNTNKYGIGYLYSLLLLLTGLFWGALAFTSNPYLAVLFLTLGWVPSGVLNVMSMVLIQSATPPKAVGRVISAVTGISVGLAPLGALIGGILGEVIGVNNFIIAVGTVVVISSAYWVVNKLTRTIPSIAEIQEKEWMFTGKEQDGNIQTDGVAAVK